MYVDIYIYIYIDVRGRGSVCVYIYIYNMYIDHRSTQRPSSLSLGARSGFSHNLWGLGSFLEGGGGGGWGVGCRV